jgi:hypothetical protein
MRLGRRAARFAVLRALLQHGMAARVVQAHIDAGAPATRWPVTPK